jgi:hypothetical protein
MIAGRKGDYEAIESFARKHDKLWQKLGDHLESKYHDLEIVRRILAQRKDSQQS